MAMPIMVSFMTRLKVLRSEVAFMTPALKMQSSSFSF